MYNKAIVPSTGQVFPRETIQGSRRNVHKPQKVYLMGVSKCHLHGLQKLINTFWFLYPTFWLVYGFYLIS